MKTAAKLTGFAMMLSFLAFVWLSHTGILPGSAEAHFFGGVGVLIIAICGFITFYSYDSYKDDKFFNPLMIFYGLLLVFNAVFYIFLKTANLIGPYPIRVDDGSEVLLGLFYLVLAIGGLYAMYDISKD